MKENQRCCDERSLKENLVEQVNITYIKRMRVERGDIRELTIE